MLLQDQQQTGTILLNNMKKYYNCNYHQEYNNNSSRNSISMASSHLDHHYQHNHHHHHHHHRAGGNNTIIMKPRKRMHFSDSSSNNNNDDNKIKMTETNNGRRRHRQRPLFTMFADNGHNIHHGTRFLYNCNCIIDDCTEMFHDSTRMTASLITDQSSSLSLYSSSLTHPPNNNLKESRFFCKLFSMDSSLWNNNQNDYSHRLATKNIDILRWSSKMFQILHHHLHHRLDRIQHYFVKFLMIFTMITIITHSTTIDRYVNANSSSRSIRIMAPDYIFYRDPMWLNCTVIDLDYNQIYSIKWFKDNDEMYRFITADPESPTTFYDTDGIVIDETRSNYGNLYISRAEFKTEADFRCEVLAENDFQTAIQIKKIKVYYIPRDGQPIIVGKKSHFGANEPVNLTCTSPMSTPAARLVVNLNGNSLLANGSPNVQIRTYHRLFENGQSSTSVNVQFPGSWLQTKRINQFECTSSIIHRFNRTASLRVEMKVDQNNHTVFYPMVDRSTTNTDRLAPRIENYKKKYELGETISLRCLSAQYKPMPELYWLLNGEPLDAQYLDYKQSDYHINGFVRLDLKYRLGGGVGSTNNNNVGQNNNNNNHYYSTTNNNNNNNDNNNLGHRSSSQNFNGNNNHHLFHQHQRRQHHSINGNNNNGPKHQQKQLLEQQSSSSSSSSSSWNSWTIDSYNFECVQMLSNVISVSSEVVQLYGTSSSSQSANNNHESEQSLPHGNSVEAVKSFIGNGAWSLLSSSSTTRTLSRTTTIHGLTSLMNHIHSSIWTELFKYVLLIMAAMFIQNQY